MLAAHHVTDRPPVMLLMQMALFLQVACRGRVQTGILTYDFDSSQNCNAAEQFSWRQAAEQFARDVGVVRFM